MSKKKFTISMAVLLITFNCSAADAQVANPKLLRRPAVQSISEFYTSEVGRIIGHVEINTALLTPKTSLVDNEQLNVNFNFSDALELGNQDLLSLFYAFKATNFNVTAHEISTRLVGAASWSGRIDNVEGSHVAISSINNIVRVVFQVTNQIIILRPADGGVFDQNRQGIYAVILADQEDFDPEDDPVPFVDDGAALTPNPKCEIGATPVIHDLKVAIFYTKAAREAAKSEENLKNTVNTALIVTEEVYNNSDVFLKIDPVTVEEIEFPESGLGNMFSRWEYHETSRQRQRQLRVSVRTLITEKAYVRTNNKCGRGISPGSRRGPPSYLNAYNIVRLGCLDNMSLPHEIAHNLGAGHDRANECSHIFDYSCGYRGKRAAFSTVMAYGTSDRPRIRFFSNPRKIYRDKFGVSENTGVAEIEDNARTLNEVRCFASKWGDQN